MTFFTAINSRGESCGVWRRDGSTARKIGVPEPEKHLNSHFAIANGQSLHDAMADRLKAFFVAGAPCLVKDMSLKPGEYYRRMARPSDQHPTESPGHTPESGFFETEVAISRGQLVSLMNRLKEICQMIHPSDDTYDCYGHEIRNLIILACTEVEAQWKGILAANGYVKGRYNTNDYVLLNGAMRLKRTPVPVSSLII